MADDTDDLKSFRKHNAREIDNSLKHYLKLESGLGNSSAFVRGHTYSFEWCSEDPEVALPAAVAAVNHYMESGLSFADAFDKVREQQASCNHGQHVSDLIAGILPRCRFCGE